MFTEKEYMKQVIQLTVRTNAPETKITKQEGDYWKMDVHAPPENNKANLEIIKFLSKHFDIDVKILKGFTSRKKQFLKSQRDKRWRHL